MKEINKIEELIRCHQRIVFFTGAGISVDSGIPDFRSAGGLYNTDLSAEEMLSHHFFVEHPKEFFDFYRNKMLYPDALPNKGHQFIADLEKLGKDVAVITQNIDGLHQKAGSSKVIELHGSVSRNYCERCHKFYGLDKILESEGIPYCDCGGIIKPDVVLYEESLDYNNINRAVELISDAEVLFVLGSSLTVYPAAGFIRYYRGSNLILINKSSTTMDDLADLVINDSISDVFSRIDLSRLQ